MMAWGAWLEAITREQLVATAIVASSFISLCSVVAAIFIGRRGYIISFRNQRMAVIQHCNARYAELYKLKNDIDHVSAKKIENENAAQKESIIREEEGLRSAYFRQYWGLKSDQIDYWLAGYVDPETLLSWILSMAQHLLDGRLVGGQDYRASWTAIRPEHQSVNPTLVNIVENTLHNGFPRKGDSTQLFAMAFLILQTEEERTTTIRNLLSVRPGTYGVFRIGWPTGLTGSNRL